MRVAAAHCLAVILILAWRPLSIEAADALPKPRLAILLQGGPDAQLPLIQDLLFASLIRRTDFVLVERNAIDAILKEHALALAAGADIRPDDLLKCGQLLSAEGLLLLGMERKTGEELALRVRLLDARLGLKLLDTLIPAGAQPSDLARAAEAVADCVGLRAARIGAPLKDLRVIGVSTFRSEALSARWDWLSDAIPSGIERALALHGNVVLAERREVTPLLSEREVASSLPEAILAAAWHANGTYQIDTAARRLSVAVSARKGGAAPLDFRVEGSLDELEVLCREIAQRLAPTVTTTAAKKPADPRPEAQLLADEARIFIKRKEPELALASAESASALIPDDAAYQCLYVDALVQGKLLLTAQKRSYPPDAEETFFRVLNLTERILRTAFRPGRLPDKDANEYCLTIERALVQALNFLATDQGGSFSCGTKMVLVPTRFCLSQDQREPFKFSDYDACVDRFWAVCLICVKTYKDRFNDPFRWAFLKTKDAVHLTRDADRALQRANWVVEEQRQTGFDVNGLDTFICVKRRFASNPKVIRELETYNATLLYSKDDLTRYRAAVLGMDMSFSPNSVRSYADAFVTLCLEQNRPDIDELCSRTYSSAPEESARIEADFLMAFTTSFLLTPSRQKTLGSQLSESWSRSTLRLADILEKNGRQREAAEWVSKVISAEAGMRSGGSRSAAWTTLSARLDKLSDRRPSSGAPSAVTPANTYQAKVLFKIDDLAVRTGIMSSRHFDRLLLSPSGPVIVYDLLEFGYDKMTCGLIRLNSISNNASQIRSYALGGKRFPQCFSLSCAMRGSDVYVGHPEQGILFFRTDGGVTLLNESSGLAYNHVRNLERLGNKLYAIVGTYEAESGLMEIDLDTRSSRMLASTKSEDPSVPINGLRINGLAADTVHNKLWLLCTNAGLRSQRHMRVYSYTPKTGAYRKVEDPSLTEFLPMIPVWDEVRYLGACADSLIFQGVGGFMQFNLNNSRGEVCPSPGERSKLLDSHWYYYRTILTKEGSVSAASTFLVFLRNGVSDPLLIDEHAIPRLHCSSAEITDFAVTKDGLYVLTRELLCLIPQIH